MEQKLSRILDPLFEIYIYIYIRSVHRTRSPAKLAGPAWTRTTTTWTDHSDGRRQVATHRIRSLRVGRQVSSPKTRATRPTIKATKSGEIESFSDEDLLEIHQIRQDLIKIYSRFTRSSQISARSRPIWRNIGNGCEISKPTTKSKTEPTPTWNPTDPNQVIWQLKRVGFGFDFYPLEKVGSGPSQA